MHPIEQIPLRILLYLPKHRMILLVTANSVVAESIAQTCHYWLLVGRCQTKQQAAMQPYCFSYEGVKTQSFYFKAEEVRWPTDLVFSQSMLCPFYH